MSIDIDAAFLINLKKREDRRMKAMSELASHEIPFYLWIATEDKNGRKGLVKTMKSLLTNCLENDYQNVLIFEDDIKVLHTEFGQAITDCADELPQDYDLMYLGCNMYGTPIRYSNKLLHAVGMYSTHAILYSRFAIERILKVLDENEAYDITLVKKIQPAMKCFCAYPILASQHEGFSDIEGRNIEYTKFIEKRFAEKTKNL